MLEPMGPLPEGVYWRRRAVGVGALVVGLFLGLWAFTALAGGDDQDAAGPGVPAAPATSPPRTSATATSAPVQSSSAAPSTVPPNSAAPMPPSAAASPGAPRGPAAPNAAPAVAAPRPPPPPGPCPDQVIGLTAQPSQPAYRRGERRELRMVVTNTGPVPCFRDLNQALQEVLVLAADGTRLWSSNDCYTAGEPSMRRLAPAEQVVSSVVWAGRTSGPGCPVLRHTVPPGDYQLVVKLGPLSSPPAPFRLLN